MKKAVSFKINPKTLADLRELAKEEKSQAFVIEKGIELYKQAKRDHKMRLSELHTILCDNITSLDADPDYNDHSDLHDLYLEIKRKIEEFGV